MNFFVNFYETTSAYCKAIVDKAVNSELEGRVLYYAMYSKTDKELYYTCIYDRTPLWSRVKLVLWKLMTNNPNYYEEENVFKYTDVYDNVENLTSFMIDAVIVTYVKENRLVTHVLSYTEDNQVVPTLECLELQKSSSNSSNYIYAILDHEGCEYDFTKEMNAHVCDMLGSPLSIGDFITIFNERYKKLTTHNIGITDATLKVMNDCDFQERLLKMNG